MRGKIKDSNILVTGGAGFIGSHLVDRLWDEGANSVTVIDNMFLGKEENLRKASTNGTVLYKDDAEFESSVDYILDNHKIDIVFNCATKALNYSFMNPSNAFMTNVNVLSNLLEALRKKRYQTLCHFSTSEVYGSAIYEPMDEMHPFNPTTTYAAGKAAADIMLDSYVRMFDLDAFIVRPFNNYGPRQNYKGNLSGIIPRTVLRILNNDTPEIHGTGKQSRDFIYVQDTVDAVVKVYNKLSAGESVNISTNGQISVKELIDMICEEMNYTGKILQKESRSSDVFCHIASNKKITNLINYRLTPFKEGLSKTINWYKTETGEYYND